MENIFNIWKSGYAVRASLGTILVGETDRAYKFKVLNSSRDLFFHLPKKAVKFDPTLEATINLAHWFTADEYLRGLFDRYANHYAR
jgi:hypothetical protein